MTENENESFGISSLADHRADRVVGRDIVNMLMWFIGFIVCWSSMIFISIVYAVFLPMKIIDDQEFVT